MSSNLVAGKRSGSRMTRPAALSNTLQRKLNAYALVASAAGVAALACAPQAEAAPVCKNLSIQIAGNNTIPFNPGGAKVPPFQLAQTTFGTFTSNYGRESQWNRGFLVPNSIGANLLLGQGNFPANVASGASIGPGGDFGKGASYGLLFTYGVGSPFSRHHGTLSKHEGNLNLKGTNYAGVQFSQNGKTHYGWIRLKVTVQSAQVGKTTTIHYDGWGFESTPDTAIAAGSCSNSEVSSALSSIDPNAAPQHRLSASLGMLAVGNAGIQVK
jgi:hypothetical protein